jgi:uncharacterized protein YjbI with pentapeptide repeats
LRHLSMALVLLILLAVILGMLWSFGIVIDLPWWLAIGVLTLLAAAIYGASQRLPWPAWASLSETLPESLGTDSSKTGKILWDWVKLLAIPLTLLVAITVMTSAQRATRLQLAANRQAQSVLMGAEKDLSDLLLNKKLAQSRPGDEVRLVARAEVSNALRQLDPERKRDLVTFLSTANLISGRDPLVNLPEADLSQADLSQLDLSQVNLSGANLSGANLSNTRLVGVDLAQANLQNADLSQADCTGANLQSADLQGASLSGTILNHANLLTATNVQPALPEARTLSGTILPNGVVHP